MTPGGCHGHLARHQNELRDLTVMVRDRLRFTDTPLPQCRHLARLPHTLMAKKEHQTEMEWAIVACGFPGHSNVTKNELKGDRARRTAAFTHRGRVSNQWHHHLGQRSRNRTSCLTPVITLRTLNPSAGPQDPDEQNRRTKPCIERLVRHFAQ